MILDELAGKYTKEETALFKEFDWTRKAEEIPEDSRGGKVFAGQDIDENLNFIPDMIQTNYTYDKVFGRVDE